MKDLVLLVADKNMHYAIKGALERPVALDIRPVDFEFRVHYMSDEGKVKTIGAGTQGFWTEEFHYFSRENPVKALRPLEKSCGLKGLAHVQLSIPQH